MKKSCAVFACLGAFVAGCDLHPRIVALPDSVGDFISDRYPALLADPVEQADIYNSAATDYGVYASPELYGTYARTDDYVMYASVDDYIIPPSESPETPAPDAVPDTTPTQNTNDNQPPEPRVADAPETPPMGQDDGTDTDIAPVPATTPEDDVLSVPMYGGRRELLTVIPGDTLYSIARQNATTVEELAAINNLKPPYDIRVGQKLYLIQPPTSVVVQPKPTETKPATPKPAPTEPKPAAPTVNEPAPKPATATNAAPATPPARATTTRVDVTEITIVPGDTLYSISRAYAIPVNDLAVMNNLTAPFALYAGQKVRVPNLADAPVRSAATTEPATTPKTESKPAAATNTPKTETKTETKPAAKKTETKTETKPAATTAKPKEKISSDPSKKLPTIASRSSSKFSWPVRGTILSNYGAKSNGLFNDGINISASRGTAVKAAENGVVAYAGNEVKGMGNLVIIQHSDGWMTVYAHMDSMAVRRGAKVTVGQKIGTVGATGKVDKPQLHFEIRKGTKAYNPVSYLKK